VSPVSDSYFMSYVAHCVGCVVLAIVVGWVRLVWWPCSVGLFLESDHWGSLFPLAVVG
jgi:hypothetical protein